MPDRRLLVVSNRLPIVLTREGDRWKVTRGAGGLVSALSPVLSHRGGLWVGWPGMAADDATWEWRDVIVDAFREEGYDLLPVPLNRHQVDLFYEGFSNQVVWPLFHDLLESCRFAPQFWYGYLEVNRLFADETLRHWRSGSLIWVQDYQLMHVGLYLRRGGIERGLAFFLHIPFPPPDVFMRLPWRIEILRSLLAYDLVGFQTVRDRNNYIACVRRLLPEVIIGGRGPIAETVLDGRRIRIGAFPIGIDFEKFADAARSPEVASKRRELVRATGERKVILGLDRLDYTKGLAQRLRGFRSFLERHPERHGKVVMLQVVVPSREGVQRYQDLKNEVEHLVGEINGAFGTAAWIPVNHRYRSLPWESLLAHYSLADVMLVTPLKDGMNLVAKEYCACQGASPGVLVLSEFAGAAAQLGRSAISINPFDAEGVGEAIERALALGEVERRRRMRRLREVVRRRNIFWWVDRFLQAAAGHTLEVYAKEVAIGP